MPEEKVKQKPVSPGLGTSSVQWCISGGLPIPSLSIEVNDGLFLQENLVVGIIGKLVGIITH
jgi:hypothetical protein